MAMMLGKYSSNTLVMILGVIFLLTMVEVGFIPVTSGDVVRGHQVIIATIQEDDINELVRGESERSMPNVIFLIGDGMGPEQLKIASLVEYGVENGTIMDLAYPYHSLYDTRNIYNETTDSAAAGTALSTGQLTSNSRIAMDSRGRISIKTILEYLVTDFNYTAGLVTTDELYGATPATFAVHVRTRDYKSQILSQYFRQNIDVLLGGGLYSTRIGGPEGARSLGSEHGFEVVTNASELQSRAQTAHRLLGLFGRQNGHAIPYEIDRDPSVNPSLLDMARSALDVLSRKNQPFFLMIEGARIDHGGHENNLTRTVFEAIMFEKVVRLVTAFALQDNNTIVVVAADHETGGLRLLNHTLSNDLLPHSGLSREENNTIRLKRIQNLTTSWSTNGHTDTKVHFYAFGSPLFASHEVKRTPDVFWAVNHVLGQFPVVTSFQVRIDGNSMVMNVSGTIKDLDHSWSSVELFLKYDDGIIQKQHLGVNVTTIEGQVSFSQVSIDVQKNFTVWIKINDVNGGNVTSLPFSYKNAVSSSSIVSETSSQDLSSETSSISSSRITPLGITWPCFVLFIITGFLYVSFKRKGRSHS